MKHHYTEDQKARIRGMIEAFEGCREFLRESAGLGAGICHAMSLWAMRGSSSYPNERWKARTDARDLLSLALGDKYRYLEDWQYLYTGERRTYKRSVTNRLRWLDQLVTDCKAALEG